MTKKITALTKSSLILTLLVGVSLTASQADAKRKTTFTKSPQKQLKKEVIKETRKSAEAKKRISTFEIAHDSSEVLTPVKSNGKYGYINKKGEQVIKPQFDDAQPFSEGLAAVAINGKYGFIDKTGKIVIKPQYIWTESFSEGLAQFIVYNDNAEEGMGFIDKKGKVVIKPQYDWWVDSFSEGLARVKRDYHKWGFIDKKGKVVIKPQYDRAESFLNGVAKVELNGKKGYINKKGEVVGN